jgi:type III secretory pathway component EscT
VAGAARAGLDRAAPLLLALQLARELAVGLSMGLVVSLAFRAAEAAGRLADTARGANLAEVLLPTAEEGSSQRSSPLGALYMLLSTLVFLELGGVPRVLDALARSYEALPIGGGVTPAGAARVAGVVTLASARLIESAVALAAPVIVALWLTDLTLGLVARAAPQIPVYFLGLSLKGLLAVGVVLAGLAGLEAALARGLPGWMSLLARTIEALP